MHGYPRKDLLPGPFVSDRYKVSWYLLAFSTSRLFVPFFYLWTLIQLKEPSKRIWFERMIGYFVLIDVLLFIAFTLIYCFYCNAAYSPDSLCNDELDRYCRAFSNDNPDRCYPIDNTSNVTPLQGVDLEPNVKFVNWAYYTVAFFVLDYVLKWLNTDMAVYVSMASSF